MREDTLFSGVHFRNIGPTQMNGRVVDLEVNPDDPTEFYLAYASGGLWHTTNNGLSFMPLFDQMEVLSIGDIAVNWKHGLIWVGTGEANSSRSSYSGMGVYKSADKGKTWQHLGLPESHHIGEIILHPADPDIAWVAVLGHLYSPNRERGVYKTMDGGRTWRQTLYIDENTGAVEMDIDPQNPNVLYTCMWYRTRRAWDFVPAGHSSGIYKSTDGGQNWALISGKGSGFPDAAGVGRCGLAVYRGNPSILYAVVDNNNPLPDTAGPVKRDTARYVLSDFRDIDRDSFLRLDNARLDTFLRKKGFPGKYTAASVKDSVRLGRLQPGAVYDWLVADDGFQQRGIAGCEIYRSDDGGRHWYRTHEKGLKVFSSYGYYFGKISVSPVDDRKVVVSGIQLLYSEDGGKKFTATDKRNTHGDWHGCWMNPRRDSHWIAVNDGGCNITYDNGRKWFKAASVPAAQFYHITTDNAVPYRVYGGLQDNGSWVGPSVLPSGEDDDGDEDTTAKNQPDPEEFEWQAVNGGDGMQVQVDTRDNATLYSGYQFGYYSRQSPGKESLNIHPMHDLGKPKLRYNWQTPILLSRHSQDILYYGANRLYRSMRQGEGMEPVSADLTKGKRKGSIPFGTITSISESPLRFGLLYAGTDDGLVQVSRDGGYTFSNISQGLPSDLWVSRVVASRYREGRVYVTLNGYRYDHFLPYLYVSEDYGQSWTQLGSDLPAEPLNVVREDPMKEEILYVGSDNGAYISLDRGNRFHTLGHNLPRVAVHDLVIQERELELVLGTHGRGIYITGLRPLHEAYERKARTKLFLPAPETPAGKKRKRD